jgi:hypothetical protein
MNPDLILLDEPFCHVCGCTEADACVVDPATGETCFWVEPELCSECACPLPVLAVVGS